MKLPRLRLAWLWLRKYWWRLWLGERVKLLAELAGMAGNAGVLALVAVAFGHVWAAWLVAVCAAAVALSLVRRRWWRMHRYRTFRFPLRDHPQVAAVIADAARTAGFAATPKVWLTSRCFIFATRKLNGRPALIIGLPMLIGMSERDLHAVLARELLGAKRLRRHEHWALSLYVRGEAAWAEQACQSLRRSIWAEARTLLGADRLRTASWAEAVVDSAFDWYVTRYAAHFMHRGSARDLYGGFRWKVEHDGLLGRISPQTIIDDELDEGPWGTGELPDGMRLHMRDRLEWRLARHLGGLMLDETGRASYRLGELPDGEWGDVLEAEREAVLEAAAVLLDRRPATDADIIALASAGRAAELDWWHAHAICPHPSRDVCVLVPLVDVSLRRKGYVHEQVFAQRVLVGPSGDRVNVVERAKEIVGG
ncbi:hypothetical protein SAMN05444920_102182 [Nonomuraea solani]|uniref:Zn-dependent protease with chaperone function n=1 Tax=Nonomuraea solani TaxID=1144553 RepID=A0A1H5Y934_9ACTN|nr:hypothetical protein [Nonomuraea solani]SEG20332.1 hypothetical protein SAMN05444920_102182 [Nonomuraea solani]